MALNGNFRDFVVTLKDGTGTPLECELTASLGDLQISGLGDLYETIVTQVRGELHSLRKGNRTFPTFSMGLLLSEFSLAGTGNVADFIRGTGGYSARVSTSEALGDVFTCDVLIEGDLSSLTGGTDTDLLLEDVKIDFDISEGEQNTIALSGTVYGAITPSIN